MLCYASLKLHLLYLKEVKRHKERARYITSLAKTIIADRISGRNTQLGRCIRGTLALLMNHVNKQKVW